MSPGEFLSETEGIGYARGRFVGLDEPVIPIEDRAHQFGDGVYEVIRVYGGKPFLLQQHLERFWRSAKWIELQLDRSLQELQELIEEAITRAGFSEAQVYFQLSRGIVKRDHAFPNVPSHLSLTVRPVNLKKWEKGKEYGQHMILVEDIRWKHCHIKSLNLLPNVWMKQKAIDQGADDAIFVREGVVTECTSSNLALVRDGVIFTHPANEHILHGITRRFIMENAHQIGIQVREETFSSDALYDADEVFTMGTMSEILPVTKVMDTPIKTRYKEKQSITYQLQQLLREAIHNLTHNNY
ncbi:aminotransferase class IV [Sulfoacidibacillus thermotolerans]|uniref:D-amino-acid transaminase n=1 Tax=Sulfoacidibacillus thermotolerans TaxID=1765684 RepID=A0A2U3DCF6_SULT2|nr:aminotransferase class IV [Sulfoacidibacillus thermotolerans]PWI58956.1 hypothetical protein BM613_02475 [Sulfoacidibacillus thermotolerans]